MLLQWIGMNLAWLLPLLALAVRAKATFGREQPIA
jgi:hypothetical protein